MKNKYSLSILFLAGVVTLFLLPLASGESSFIFKAGEDIELNIECLNTTNHFCNPNTACNLTIFYPNSTVMINNDRMNHNQAFFNYTITSARNVVIGTYSANVNCIGTTTGFSTFNYDITRTGRILTTAEGLLYLAVFVISIFIFLLCFWGALVIPFANPRNTEGFIISFNDLKFVKILLWAFSYLILIWVFFMAREISGSFLNLDVATTFFYLVYNFLVAALFPIFVATLLIFIILFVNSKKLKKKLIRGIPTR